MKKKATNASTSKTWFATILLFLVLSPLRYSHVSNQHRSCLTFQFSSHHVTLHTLRRAFFLSIAGYARDVQAQDTISVKRCELKVATNGNKSVESVGGYGHAVQRRCHPIFDTETCNGIVTVRANTDCLRSFLKTTETSRKEKLF